MQKPEERDHSEQTSASQSQLSIQVQATAMVRPDLEVECQTNNSTTSEPEKSDYKKKQQVLRQLSKLALKPKPGHDWNPLLKVPRNNPCPCQSGKKFKHCHLNLVPRIVEAKQAQHFKTAMKGKIKFI